MSKQIKPTRAWGVTYTNSPQVMPWSIRERRRDATESISDGDWTWARWRKAGCRVVKVTIIQDEPK